MRGPAALLLVAALAVLAPRAAGAQTPVVISSAPSAVAVTVYRDSTRYKGSSIVFDADGDPLGGFALIDELREVDLPAGAVTVRFEGVASGIVPQSAMLFDTDLAEKNFDSRLLSQRGLIDAFTGQSVTVRRTERRSGRQTTEQGIIVSRPDGLVLKTAGGYEAIQCEGGLSTVLFPGRPPDLTARPTLSLTTRPDQKGGRVRLHLAYLAANFDWQANYVGTFAPDGRSLELSSWMTLASHDRTSFPGAELSVIAGEVYRAQTPYEAQEALEEEQRADPYAPDNIDIAGECWPMGTTAAAGPAGQLFAPRVIGAQRLDVALNRLAQFGYDGSDEENQGIVVTGSRIMRRGELGDLKLYTMPQPTTVAAQSMKQVRLMETKHIRGEALYRARYRDDYLYDDALIFRFRNDKEAGLGDPLPMGMIALFQQTSHGRHLLGEVGLDDKAEEEQIEIELPEGSGDTVDISEEQLRDDGKGRTRRQVTVTNDNSFPIVAEVEFSDTDEHRLSRFSRPLFRRDGKQVWRVEVPAGSERSISFRNSAMPEPDED